VELQDIIERTRNLFFNSWKASMEIPCETSADGVLVVMILCNGTSYNVPHCRLLNPCPDTKTLNPDLAE
jgi:hypothetical protein